MALEALFLGVVQSLLSSGLSRMGSLAAQKAARLARIETALKGLPMSSPAVQTAINDLRTVMGHDWGEPTSAMGRLLKDLQSTGLGTAIAEQAIFGRRLSHTEDAFLMLYSSLFPSSAKIDGAHLYNKICTVFEACLGSLMNDPALTLMIASISKNIENQLLTITERLASGLVPAAPFEDYNELQGFLQRLTRSLASSYKNIRVETNKGAKNVDIDRIFVPSKLRYRDESRIIEQFSALHERTRPAARTSADRAAAGDPRGLSIPYSEFEGTFRRVVVLGDPGGGKSTLCQYVCYKLAKNYSLRAQFPEPANSHVAPQSARVPLRVVLRNFEAARLKETQLAGC